MLWYTVSELGFSVSGNDLNADSLASIDAEFGSQVHTVSIPTNTYQHFFTLLQDLHLMFCVATKRAKAKVYISEQREVGRVGRADAEFLLLLLFGRPPRSDI